MSGLAQNQLERHIGLRRWLLSFPALFIILVGAAGPLVIVFIYSFLTPGEYGDVIWKFSFDGWINVLFDRDIFDDHLSLAVANLSIVWRSVWLAFLTTIVTLFVGFPTAYFIATRPATTRDLWLFLITIPFWTNLLIRTFAIQEVIRNEGAINLLLMRTGIISEPIQMMYTDFAVLIGMAYVYLPLMVLPLYASMEKLDFRLVEAGYDLYATPWRVLLHIVIPVVKAGLVSGAILVFIPSLGAYVTPRILGGGGNLMIGNFIELQFGQGRNWPLGSALSISLLIVVMVALFYYARKSRMEKGNDR